MELNKINSIYFLGIGGIGMSAIARYFHKLGKDVWGYDRSKTPLTEQLEAEGIAIHYEENPELIPEKPDLVVYTPAIADTHAEWEKLRSLHVPIIKRAAILGSIANEMKTIAIAGTHGKTTITSICAHLIDHAGIPVNAFIGGIANNFGSNIVLNPKAKIMVVEADEYDRSFLHLFPDIAIVNSMDADHLDIYGEKEHLLESFELFVSQIKQNGQLFIKKGLSINSRAKTMSYSANEDADISAKNIFIKNGRYHFDLKINDNIYTDVNFTMPGRYNIENALAACCAAWKLGLSPEQIVAGLESYKGVRRRFDIRVQKEDIAYIDDYAHHPEELKATIASVRELYPQKKICGIFQPHLFSRTRDFADDFATALEALDSIVLLDIYPARELPLKGINSEMLLDKINKTDKQVVQKNKVLDFIKSSDAEVFITLGAGDIDQLVENIENVLNK